VLTFSTSPLPSTDAPEPIPVVFRQPHRPPSTAAHQPQPNLISNSDWRRFKAAWEAHQKRIVRLLFKLCVSLPLSFHITWTPSETTSKRTSRSSGHLCSINVATTQVLVHSSDDSTPHGSCTESIVDEREYCSTSCTPCILDFLANFISRRLWSRHVSSQRVRIIVQCTAYLKAIKHTWCTTLPRPFRGIRFEYFFVPPPARAVNVNFASSTTTYTTPRPQPSASSHQPTSISKDTTTSLRV